MASTKIRLGELLVRAGVLDESKLKTALAEQRRWGGRLGKVLVDMGFVTEDLLVKALSKQLGIARADFGRMNVPQDILAKVDVAFARKHALCPEFYEPNRKVLVVAMADPTNVAAVDELRFNLGVRIETTLAGEHQVGKAIEHFFSPQNFGEGLELGGSGSIIQPDDMYRAAMAASGLEVDAPNYHEETVPKGPPPELPGGYGFTDPGAETDDAPLELGLNESPHLSTQPINTQSINTQNINPQGTQAPMISASGDIPGSVSASAANELVSKLDGAQRQQVKAIRAMVELLVEKGVFSMEEYLALINRR